MIKIENFTKNYYEFPSKKTSFSVSDINIQINDGEICAILGSNGSGKTTIIKALCNFHNPSNGKIFITDIKNNPVDYNLNPESIMENLGYVPEISLLPQNMKVKDFLKYAASIHMIEDKKTAINNVIEKCSLEKVLNKKIKTLSKGYKQRVSFAQAIIHNPKNLILDEPISGLDPAQIVQMRSLIKELSANKAILISTHILQEVTSLCNRAYIINNGKLVASGSETEIINYCKTSNFEEAFIKLTSEKNEDTNEK